MPPGSRRRAAASAGGGAWPAAWSACAPSAATIASAASRQRPVASARRQARKPIEGTSFWPKPPSDSSVGPACARASSAHPVGDHVQRLHRPLVAGEEPRRRRVLEQLVGEALGELAQVGPHDPDAVHRGGGAGVVVAAGRDHGPQRAVVVGQHVDGVVGDRAQRDLRGALGLGLDAPHLTQDAREDAEAHRSLVRLADRGRRPSSSARSARRAAVSCSSSQRPSRSSE